MSQDIKKFMKIMENTTIGGTNLNVAIVGIIQTYLDDIMNANIGRFINLFPVLDDDTLSDSISIYLKKNSIEYSIELYQEIMNEIRKKYKVIG